MKQLPEHQKGIIAVLIAAVLWSSGGILIKLITFHPMQISFFRGIFAALVFAIIFRKKAFIFNGMTFVNGIFYAGILILFVIATKLTTAANAIFLQYTAPIYVLVFEPLINKTEFKRINVITIFVCFVGMIEPVLNPVWVLIWYGEVPSFPAMIGGIIIISAIAFRTFIMETYTSRKMKKKFT